MLHLPQICKVLSFAGCLALAGCAHMAPSTAMHLVNFDPLRADPAEISVALLLPDSLLLHDNDVVLTLQHQDKAQSSTLQQSFLLKVIDAGTNPIDGLQAKPGQRLQLAKASVADVSRLRTLQLAVQQQQSESSRGNSGALTIGVQGGCATRPLGNTPLLASIFIRTDKSSRYYSLYTDMDLRKTFGNAVIAKVPACAA